MTAAWVHFMAMGGYGAYIWTAYGIVLAALSLQWFIPWRRWRKYAKRPAQWLAQDPEKRSQYERNT